AEVQRTMMQLLSEMDGFESRGEIRILAATNRFDMLDPAILRPGRFDRLIEVPKPDAEGRRAIFEIHTRGMNVEGELDYEALAAATDGASGAEIAAICTEAGMYAIREDRDRVRPADLEQAIEKVLAGDDDDDISKTFA
ncbi:MAG: AAA family ATPase, partial [Halobacteriales archaeon]